MNNKNLKLQRYALKTIFGFSSLVKQSSGGYVLFADYADRVSYMHQAYKTKLESLNKRIFNLNKRLEKSRSSIIALTNRNNKLHDSVNEINTANKELTIKNKELINENEELKFYCKKLGLAVLIAIFALIVVVTKVI